MAEAAQRIETILVVARRAEQARRARRAIAPCGVSSRTRSARTRLSSISGWRISSCERNSLEPKSRTRSRSVAGSRASSARKLERAPIAVMKARHVAERQVRIGRAGDLAEQRRRDVEQQLLPARRRARGRRAVAQQARDSRAPPRGRGTRGSRARAVASRRSSSSAQRRGELRRRRVAAIFSAPWKSVVKRRVHGLDVPAGVVAEARERLPRLAARDSRAGAPGGARRHRQG